jgi:AP-4 complex subunit sigma-1
MITNDSSKVYQSLKPQTELDIVFNLEKVHMIMDEIVVKGMILEVNQERILGPIYALANQNVKSVS